MLDLLLSIRGGREVMRVPAEDTAQRFAILGHGNIKSWIPPEDIIRSGQDARDVLLIRHQEAKVRDVECRDPDCWCRAWLP